jgi:shikimate dehydrogenase
MRIDGNTRLLAHVGDPTSTFKAPLIYNPYFAKIGFNGACVPMGVTAAAFATAFPAIMRFTNVDGALITMPHKRTVVAMLAEASTAVRITGACNAVRRLPDGGLAGDMFDGEGFVRALKRGGRAVSGRSALIVGSGGVGSAIAAALAAAGIGRMSLTDKDMTLAEALAGRIAAHYPAIRMSCGGADPAGHDIVVNGTPLGMRDGDPLPFDVARVDPGAIVGEVVLKRAMTPLLQAAAVRGLAVQPGIDMLYEQIPAYLAFFGMPVATAEELREIAPIGD